MTSRTSCSAGPTRAKVQSFCRASSFSQKPPAKVLPDPRPPSSTQVRQSASSGAICSSFSFGVALIPARSILIRTSRGRLSTQSSSKGLALEGRDEMIDTGEEFGLEPGQFGVADITIVFAHFILIQGLAGGLQRRHRLGRPRQDPDGPRPFLGLGHVGRRLGRCDHGDRLIGQGLQPVEDRRQPLRLIRFSRHA
ncbi:hypothetical protein D3C85_1116470 [compost metagenome]